MRTVAEILGHKTLAMVQRYSHLSPEHLRGELTRTMESVNINNKLHQTALSETDVFLTDNNQCV